MATRMLQRRGTAAEWAAQNPILGDGEIGFERDTKVIKLGDGVTPWNDLTLGQFVPTGGGEMTGPLSLVAPTEPAHGARKIDIDNLDNEISQKHVLYDTFLTTDATGQITVPIPPSSYRDVILAIEGRATTQAGPRRLAVIINGDSQANSHRAVGTRNEGGTITGVATASNFLDIGYVPDRGIADNVGPAVRGSAEATILNYQDNSQEKIMHYRGGTMPGLGLSDFRYISGIGRKAYTSDPVTFVLIAVVASNLASGSRITVYGR